MEEQNREIPQQKSEWSGWIPSTSGFTPQNSNLKGLLIFLVVILLLGSGGIFAVQQNNISKKLNDEQAVNASPALSSPIAPYTVVYGTWTGEGSLIKSYDLSTGDNPTLALLPINVKKVSVLSSDTLLYIDQTDERDYGKQLAIYSITGGKTQVAIKAAEGYGIDDYVVSPNKQYVATWEVSIPEGAVTLAQGKSRVYTVSINNPSQKNLIYDEDAKNPIHYPRAILDNGKVFLDTFRANDPNGGTGWAYGMSVANFDGSGKQELTQMANGTYGTQPSLSPDGKTLLFAGYDGSYGPGTVIKNGYRQALLTPNTIETLDVNTLTRQKLSEFVNSNVYPSVEWDKTSKNIVLSLIAKDSNQTGKYLFDNATKTSKKIMMPSSVSEDLPTFITPLASDKFFFGITDDSTSTVANLGDTYSATLKQLSVVNATGSNLEQIKITDQFVQYISLLPSDFFDSTVSIMNSDANPTQTIVTGANSSGQTENLQLYTFFLKTELGPNRDIQQSTGEKAQDGAPRCRDLAAAQCGYQNASKTEKLVNLATDPCARSVKAEAKKHGHCHDSPLYLYGPKGTNVTVTVHTPVHSSTPSYKNGYTATLLGDGTFAIDNKVYSEIDYAYTSAVKKLLPPTYGEFVAKDEVENVLRKYAKGLGLNEKETHDLVSVGKRKVTSTYAFVSFYDHKKSQAILPISFNPQPDNYLNVVFYFKLLNEKPTFTVAPPTFGEPLNRTGFTAVEVSEIVE